MVSIENLSAGMGNDDLSGDGSANVLFGDDGNDVLRGRGGADALNGGNGSDTATYSDAISAVHASLAAPATNTGQAAGDTYISIENLAGSANADMLWGDSFGNRIDGGSAADTISGGDGSDTLAGGSGADYLAGGMGADLFSYASAAESTNQVYVTIDGFDALTDRLDISVAVTGINAAITAGPSSSTASIFASQLVATVDASRLAGHHAIAFTPNTGALAGIAFLIVDINGIAGYQNNADLLIKRVSPASLTSLSTADFM